MFYISHRGNLYGRIPERENSPGYIAEALRAGYHCEVDVWFLKDEGWLLGHDVPQYPIDIDFLCDPRLWCHAKNEAAFIEMTDYPNIVSFWHDSDRYTFTSDGYIWTFSYTRTNGKCIVVYPELSSSDTFDDHIVAGYCSDYIGNYKK